MAAGSAALLLQCNKAAPKCAAPPVLGGMCKENSNMRNLYVAAAAAALVATPAFAQDATPPAFNGGHIEAIGGFDSIHGGGDSENGLAFGIAGGYDFRTG